MTNKLELALIFVAVIIGVVSAAYFYVSAGIFMDLLKRPLKLISSGMFVIAIGVLLAAFISYESSLGLSAYFYGIPLQAAFYVLYIVGSIMIAFGARQFTAHPKGKVQDVSMGKPPAFS
jgi:MFS family permease